MRKVNLICVGKTQDQYLQLGLEKFEKKLRPYCKYSFKAVKEANYGQGNLQTCLLEEEKRLLQARSKGSFMVVCDEKGKQLNSIELSEHLMKWSNQGYSEVDFIVGGAYGLTQNLKKQASFLLSFSRFTMTHQMIRLFLIEQIYRSHSLIHGQKYHHV